MKLTFPRVLVIDDDPQFRDAMRRWLGELGYDPVLAESASAGSEHLGTGSFAAVLLDLHLPDIHGHALLVHLNRMGLDVPVIVMSGVGEMDDVVRAFREKAADYLKKPFRTDDLANALARATRPRTALPSETAPIVLAPATPPAVPRASPPPPPPPPPPAAEAAKHDRQAGEPGPKAVRGAVARLTEEIKQGRVKLPLLDPQVTQLQEMLERDDLTMQEVIDTIGRDPALTAAVLRVANSAFYARGDTTRTVRDACVRLGTKRLVTIAFEAVAKSQFVTAREPYSTILASMWRNCVVASRIASALAIQLKRKDAEELQVLTLLHNIGEVVCVRLVGDMNAAQAARLNPEELALEIDRNHETLGEAVARSWQLPSSMVQIISHHHRPAMVPEEEHNKQLRAIVLASWAMAQQAGFTYFTQQAAADPSAYLQVLRINRAVADSLIETARTWEVT